MHALILFEFTKGTQCVHRVMQVLVREVPAGSVPPCSRVFVEPQSPDDWEILVSYILVSITVLHVSCMLDNDKLFQNGDHLFSTLSVILAIF